MLRTYLMHCENKCW